MRPAFLAVILAASSAGGPVIDSMDVSPFRPPAAKGVMTPVDGHSGRAVEFTFEKDARGAFFTSGVRGTPEWDAAEGFSFRVKGDGSDAFGGLEFIYDDDYAVRYDYAFPLKSTEWTKVVVAWDDLIPVLPGPRAKPLGGEGGNRPSKLSALWVGKWWYWGDYPAHSFAIDDLRLEPKVERPAVAAPPEAPLRRVLDKLKAGKPVTIVTAGDSLTDARHWANRKTNWPTLLRDRLKAKYGAEVTVVNPAIGGTQLRQNLVLGPRWLARTPEPDLVTVFFGGNDWEAGMRGPEFRAANADAVDRLRRATQGKADVLLLTTAPSAAGWGAVAELAEAVRLAAGDCRAGLADVDAAFVAAGAEDKDRLYVSDRVHLSPAGHDLVAKAVMDAIEAAGAE